MMLIRFRHVSKNKLILCPTAVLIVLLFSFHDFGLDAGYLYTYTVEAFNNVGSVKSEPPATATTDPAAPAGLDPPALSVSSSSSIMTEWEAPAKPNGQIVNYTLLVRQEKSAHQKVRNLIVQF